MGMQLLSTDFDGTLVGFPQRLACPPLLSDALVAARAADVAWVINTGRSLEHLEEGLAEFAAPHAPDYAVVNERHLYELRGRDWIAIGTWNERCDEEHHRLGQLSAPALRQILKHAARSLSFEVLEERGYPIGVITRDEETMEKLVGQLRLVAGEHPDFDFQRNAIYLRFSHRSYTKGTTLAELARFLALPKAGILAIGDNHNDLSMLDGTHAGMVACPVNAVEEIRRAVRTANGFVSDRPDAFGTAEAIFNYLAPPPEKF